MKNLSGLVVLILVIGFGLPAKAQDLTPRFEAYAGYDYTRDNAVNDITHVPPSQSVNGNGGSGQLEFNATPWLGIVGDLGGYAVARNGFATTHQISYLAGPRVNFRRGGSRRLPSFSWGPCGRRTRLCWDRNSLLPRRREAELM
jgi:hypothetical protein